MPKSRNRTEHYQHQQKHHAHDRQGSKSADGVQTTARTFTIPICLVFGAGMAWFAAGPSPLWVIAGALVGAAVGYFVGGRMDQAFGKK